MSTLYQSNLSHLNLKFRGKVRDIYDLGTELLLVTSDRLSAFDVVLPDPIPGKGEVLTQLTQFWMNRFKDLVPNHSSTRPLSDVIPKDQMALYEKRSVIVKKAQPLPIECVVRGYIIGSGWKDYQKTGQICGIDLPKGLKQAQKLPEPIFTPATKAEVGDHDENISFAKAVDLVGIDVATQVRDLSFQIYTQGAEYAAQKQILVADTKFEFGIYDGKVILIDEVLTPDSSRFWPMEAYEVGMSPPSFDKQFVRDYLETLDWNKTAPGPKLPNDIIQKTAAKYQEALTVLSKA